VSNWPPNDRLRDAFRSLRDDLEQPVGANEARAAVAATRAAVARSRRHRQRLLGAIAALVISGGFLGALPQGREAVASIIDRLGAFLTGGGEAPGPPPPPGEPVALLNTLINERPGTERVIAQTGDLRMLGYRKKNGEACISIGVGYVACAPARDWPSYFTDGVMAPLLATPRKGERIAPLWGLATAQVKSVRVAYADGGEVRKPVSGYGFIVPVDGLRRPQSVEALSSSDESLAVQDISDWTWRFCPGPSACR
jgi:hypothetical protein